VLQPAPNALSRNGLHDRRSGICRGQPPRCDAHEPGNANKCQEFGGPWLARFLKLQQASGERTMMTNTMPTTTPAGALTTSPSATQKVVIVNGSTDMMGLLETVLDAGHYDVVLVESSDHAYSHIKRVQPNLVILCMRIEEPEGFQVLSMLKLDEDTRRIPVLTYTTEYEGQDADEDVSETPEIDMFAQTKAALPMN
jgi:CheY-like chemotaxis protein